MKKNNSGIIIVRVSNLKTGQDDCVHPPKKEAPLIPDSGTVGEKDWFDDLDTSE